MRRISYAGESFVTSDGVADALLRLIAALGVNHTSAAVEIPAFRVRQGARMLGDSLGATVSQGGQSRAGAHRTLRARRALARRRSSDDLDVEIVHLVAGPSTAIVSRVLEFGHEAPSEEFRAAAIAAIARLDECTDSLAGARAIIHAHPHGEMGFDFDGLESL